MTMEQLNNAVTDAQRAVAAVVSERAELDSRREKIRLQINALHDEANDLLNERIDMGDSVLKARASLRRAERERNTAVNNAIIAEHHTSLREMCRKSLLGGLRITLRSKKPIAECLVERIERGVAGFGVNIEQLSYWSEDGRIRDLSGPQVRRVQTYLNTVCPKTAAGNYLPPYEVQYPR